MKKIIILVSLFSFLISCKPDLPKNFPCNEDDFFVSDCSGRTELNIDSAFNNRMYLCGYKDSISINELLKNDKTYSCYDDNVFYKETVDKWYIKQTIGCKDAAGYTNVVIIITKKR